MISSTILLCALAVAITINLAIEGWLDWRHSNHIRSHRNTIPPRFADKVSLAAHQKAADYTITKLKFGYINALFALLLFALWSVGGALEWLDLLLRDRLALPPLGHGITLILLFTVLNTLLELPLSLYGTFHIEARFGFNRTTLATLFTDLLKQGVLMLLIATPLLALILWLMAQAGSAWWLYTWLVWSAFSLLMLWLYPTLIAPLFNRFSPLEDGEVKQRIEALLARCNFASGGLFVMDGSRRSAHGNAYFTGFGSAKRIVFFDTLLKQLTPPQIEAVLAHELGHFKHRHILQRIILSLTMALAGFALLGWLSSQPWLFTAFGITHPSNAMLLLLFMLILPWFTFWLTPLMNLLSRRHEFQADDYACTHSSASALADGLITMYEENAATLTPDPLWSAWHDSHPPAPVRIDHLTSRKMLSSDATC
ncbi:MAG: M48 family metallopeptidase [Mariprofundales bacterium]|nr:M48 family metallopeptidase [Mariprofundales bacterium]